MMNFTIDAGKQYRQLSAYKALTSIWVVFLFIFLLLAAGAIWTLHALFIPSADQLFVFAVFLASTAGGLALAFVFGSTWYSSRLPARTTTEVLQPDTDNNIAEALSFNTLVNFGVYLRTPNKQQLDSLAHAVIKHPQAQEMLNRFELNTEEVFSIIKSQVIPAFSISQFAHTLISGAAARGHEHIHTLDILAVFLLHPGMHTYLRQHKLREQDISFGIWWHQHIHSVRQTNRRWWREDRLLSFTGLGLSWASGYTPFLDTFIRIPRGNLWDVAYGHESQVDQLINTLARSRQSNALLVGQPGVGRLGIIRALSDRINAGTAHPGLNGQRLIYINISQIAAAASGQQQLGIISKALDEMERAGNIVAVLDGIGSLLGGDNTGINVTDLLLPFFSSNTVRVVVIMSTDEYHLRIKSSEELLHFFEVVHVPPLEEGTTLQLLALTSPEWEGQTELVVPYKTLREIVENTASILPYVPFPEKAFDLLEEAIVTSQREGHHSITVETVNSLISKKVGVDVGKFKAGEQEYLLQLEDIIHKRVVNQKKGVAAVARAMIRSRAGVRNRKRPIGTFLFLGPTGVGKTETAKALAEAYFGSSEYMQRLDMTQFQGQEGIEGLLGTLDGRPGQLTSTIADHPFSVLLLDEFEKADSLVQQIFMPVLDEGYLTDARGHRHSFAHTIIIATSNAGSELIRQHVGADGSMPDEFDDILREHILSQGIYRPEVLNRFDGVITFTPLTPDHVKEIAGIMIRSLNKRLDAEHGITVAVTDELLEFLAKTGYDPQFGARPLNRAIQDTVEYAVAEAILKNTTQPGKQIVLSPAMLGRQQVQ